jgi:hypothetical protein
MVLIDREGMIRYQSNVAGDELVADETALRTKIESLLTHGGATGKKARR